MRSEFQVRAMELMAVEMWVVTLCLWGPGEVDRMSFYMTIIYLNLYRPNL